ncbi:MAG: TlyA family RNA methyltransferase [Chloroflexota bacterium]|nr:TlyA family RNA methyltransferase [Chloroflexota bacterium]
MNDYFRKPRGKTRLDSLVVARGLAPSREKARALIMAGSVFIGDQRMTKPGRMVAADALLEVRGSLPYVSRGGLKLEAALDSFQLDPAGMQAADVGASTGGFTDCLLQRGAAHVYAIDVGYGQLAWKLRQDPRVTVMERTNARYLQTLPDGRLLDLAVVDVSFIGLALVMPAVSRILQPGGQAIVLIKPQFEAGRSMVGKGGVVRDPAVHERVLETTMRMFGETGWRVDGLLRSPITGPKGNIEFLCLLAKGGEASAIDVCALISDVLPSQSSK